MGPDGIDLATLPRPVAEMRDKAMDPPQPYDAYNCSPDNMRLNVNAIPNSAALRAR
jgi:protein transport protein SEC24